MAMPIVLLRNITQPSALVAIDVVPLGEVAVAQISVGTGGPNGAGMEVAVSSVDTICFARVCAVVWPESASVDSILSAVSTATRLAATGGSPGTGSALVFAN